MRGVRAYAEVGRGGRSEGAQAEPDLARSPDRRCGLAVALVALVPAPLAAIRHGFFDLHVYYGALDYWAHGHGELYDCLRGNTTYGFTYPPFAALVMLPMALLPWHAAIVVSVHRPVVTTVLLIWWLLDPVSRRQGWIRWYAFALVCCLAVAFEPLRETVMFGQVNSCWSSWSRSTCSVSSAAGSRWAGVGIGLATAIKLTPGMFIVYLLVTRRWRAAARRS